MDRFGFAASTTISVVSFLGWRGMKRHQAAIQNRVDAWPGLSLAEKLRHPLWKHLRTITGISCGVTLLFSGYFLGQLLVLQDHLKPNSSLGKTYLEGFTPLWALSTSFWFLVKFVPFLNRSTGNSVRLGLGLTSQFSGVLTAFGLGIWTISNLKESCRGKTFL
ncbi:MAG: hypothetical protein HYT76_05470 [Deltaproteobacteria bacterium]|nr:hypothetical protein [Deltaproteobacteria bacterium]